MSVKWPLKNVRGRSPCRSMPFLGYHARLRQHNETIFLFLSPLLASVLPPSSALDIWPCVWAPFMLQMHTTGVLAKDSSSFLSLLSGHPSWKPTQLSGYFSVGTLKVFLPLQTLRWFPGTYLALLSSVAVSITNVCRSWSIVCECRENRIVQLLHLIRN